jgi:hypothetical protein
MIRRLLNSLVREWRVRRLRVLLGQVRDADEDYTRRYGLVLDALALAHRLGYEAGIDLDPDEPFWPLVFIELPMGPWGPNQVSWHMPCHTRPFDGHTTAQKLQRLTNYESWGGYQDARFQEGEGRAPTEREIIDLTVEAFARVDAAIIARERLSSPSWDQFMARLAAIPHRGGGVEWTRDPPAAAVD